MRFSCSFLRQSSEEAYIGKTAYRDSYSIDWKISLASRNLICENWIAFSNV